MCKRHARHIEPMAPRAYEGKTMQLSEGAAWAAPLEARHGSQRKQCHGHYWWLMWLIWPLIGLGKALAPAFIALQAAVLAQLSAPVPLGGVLLALVLIGVGAALLRRQ